MVKIKYYMPVGEWPLQIGPYRDLMQRIGLIESTPGEAELLLLPGGCDIGLQPLRDEVELGHYQQWSAEGKPVLGICRGMELMLWASGAPMIPHLPHMPGALMHTTMAGGWAGVSSWHTTTLGLLTNSRHHQGFAHESVGPQWKVLDWTSDGIIESVRCPGQFGVQWHPEQDEMAGTAALDWWYEQVKELLYG